MKLMSGILHLRRRPPSVTPHRLFLLLFLPVAVAVAILLPPFMGPDEASHTYRAYELSKGDVFLNKYDSGMGFPIPTSLVTFNSDQYWINSNQTLRTAFSHNLTSYGSIDDGSTTVQFFEGTAPYNPIAYAPYVVGTWIGRILKLNVYTFMLLLRIIGIATYAALAFLAIRLMPNRKWLVFIIALLPMALHQAAVVSVDGIVIGLSLLCVALVARSAYLKSASRRYLAILVVAAAVLALSKQAYVILALASLLLIPSGVFKSPAFAKKFKVASIAGVLLLTGGWWFISHANADQAFMAWRARDGDAQPLGVSGWVKKNISVIPALSTLTHTFVYSEGDVPFSPSKPYVAYRDNAMPDFAFDTFFGSFGSLKVNYPHWVSVVILAALAIAFAAKEKITAPRHRLDDRLIWITIAVQAAFIVLALWIAWTPSTYNYVAGIQGRYFIPVLALAVLLPPPKWLTIHISGRILSILTAAYIAIIIILMLLLIYARFYTGL